LPESIIVYSPKNKGAFLLKGQSARPAPNLKNCEFSFPDSHFGLSESFGLQGTLGGQSFHANFQADWS
jgi:hypothetical protein